MLRPAAQVVAALAIAAAAVPVARAGGLDPELTGARGVGRAGAITVSDDDGAAVLTNPAGIVRRGNTRVRVGLALADGDTRISPPAGDPPDAPQARDEGPATRLPEMGLAFGAGPVVLGLAYVETDNADRQLPRPAVGQPPAEVSQLFAYRYGGFALTHQRHTVAAGAAVRATDWLGVGVSLTASWVTLEERRHVWAGFDGRDLVGDPTRDMVLITGGRDRFVPGIAAGLLIAPEAPIEIAMSASWAADAHLRGDADLSPLTPGGPPTAQLDNPRARADLATPLVVRSGVRYLGERVYVEADGELELYPGTDPSPTWQLDCVAAVDQTDADGPLTRAPSLVSRRARTHLRAAVDVEVVPGFLWLTAGYAFHTAGSPDARPTPVHADLGGHTLAVGAEGQWSGTTLTIGYARTLTAQRTVTNSAVSIVNPFDAGSGAATDGRYATTQDLFGAALEIAWE